MTHQNIRRLKMSAATLAALLTVLTLGGIFVAQTDWFRDFVRDKAIEAVEKSTGGKVDLAEFRFDWKNLRATLRGFVLHGTEPAGAEPLFSAREVIVDLRFLSVFRQRKVDVAFLAVDQPRVNLIISADGKTNVPKPDIPEEPDDKTGLETIVDLAIGRFVLTSGTVQVNEQKTPFSGRGEDLRAELVYELIGSRYRGSLSTNPLLLQYANGSRLEVAVNLPVAIGADRIELNGATFKTPNSSLSLTGSVDDMKKPNFVLKANGQLDIPELSAALGRPIRQRADRPQKVAVEVDGALNDQRLQIASAKFTLGQSNAEASGSFRNVALEDGSLDLRAHLAVNEITRILDSQIAADGVVDVQGQARVRTLSDYQIDGSVSGERLSYRQGTTQVTDARLSSNVMVDPGKIRIDPFRLDVVGGTIAAKAEIQQLDRYQVTGTVSRIQTQQVLAAVGARGSAWGASIAGPFSAQGSLKASSVAAANTNLALAPNGQGIPLRGQVNAAYSGANDSVDVGQSYILLPSSRIDFSGSLNRQLNLRVNSRNLDDFLPALALASSQPPAQLPVRLEAGGVLELTSTLTGRLDAPVISGTTRLTRFSVEARRFDQLTADLNADRSSAQIRNAILTRGPLQARVDASAGLNQWKTQPQLPLTATIDVRNADVLDILALAGQRDIPVRGALTMTAQVAGTQGDPQGNAVIAIRAGEAYGQPIDSADGRIQLGNGKVTLSALDIVSNMARLTLNAVFDHPTDSYDTGRVTGHVEANQVGLARLAAVRKQRPGLDGLLQLNLDAEANVLPAGSASRVEVAAVNGTIGVRGLRQNGDDLGDAQVRIQTEGKDVTFGLESNLAQSSILASGRTTLAPDYPTQATIDVKDLRIERALTLAGIASPGDAKGRFSAQGQVSGTLQNPSGELDITVTQAQYEKQVVDRLMAHVLYQPTLIQVSELQMQAGPNRLTGEGSLTHPVGNFSQGDIKVKVNRSSIQLAQVGYIQARKPGLGGVIEVALEAAGAMDRNRATPVLFSTLDADITGRNLSLGGQDYGGFRLGAKQSGSNVDFNLESNVAQSTIKGTGVVRLATDYPATADVTIQNLHYRNWAKLIGAETSSQDSDLDVLADGTIKLSGPILRPTAMTGSAQFAKLEVSTTTPAGLSGPGTRVALTNEGPISIAATTAGVQIEKAHWTGPSTDISVTGGMALQPERSLDLAVKADANLKLLQDFDRKVQSDGALVLNATIKGPVTEPAVSGRMELKNASYRQSSMLNGISRANGAIVFSGVSARIESLTAESGGGNLEFTGGATRLRGVYRFDLGATARGVRVQTPVEASVVANGAFKLSGSAENSLLSGDVDIRSVTFNQRTDFGSILSRTSAPRETPGGDRGLLDRMRLLINAKIGSSTTFRTALAENLQATADVTIRGTASTPGALGRVEVTRGELLFFGTKYKVNEGTVSFFNPAKIEPILNLNLATTARGVNVVLMVTGPVQNMNLAYQSDPPLQFSEIVALLAAGKLPTSDPVLLAHQPTTPSQTLPQMGASALVGAAVTNPVAGRLQRVFGVTQLKIDPTFTSGSELPQARLTVQQQITSELTFTYVTNLARADPQIVRVEWVIDPDWSAIATRQENGMVGVDLFYKKRFQ
jgi:translocation and assembly module TamB